MCYNCQTKHDSFARNSPISTVLTVEYFLEVILSFYRFTRVNFVFENGIVQSNIKRVNNMVTTIAAKKIPSRIEQNFNPGLINKSNNDLTSHR